ncbi:MAG: hypothetical protein H6880_00345 [Rhodobiaceae bacterium]|nr:hypothetical protein [Rhodobiaceae bacterium]
MSPSAATSALGELFRVDGAIAVESAAFDQALAWLGCGGGDAPGLDRLSMSGHRCGCSATPPT